MKNKIEPSLCPPHLCCGCSACYAVCAVGAIEMRPDREGFISPHVDLARCVGCLKCEKVCPATQQKRIQPEEPETLYAVRHKDESVRLRSSSGGAFVAMAQVIIERGGTVCASAFDSGMTARHVFAETMDDLPPLQGSKYVQSDIGDSFREIRKILKTGREVLFVGTPCQVAGLKLFLGDAVYENLFTCDFACHGVPSPLLFKKYLQWLQELLGGVVSSFNFRDKRISWRDPVRVGVVNGRSVRMRGKLDCYFFAFLRDISLRDSCYACSCKGIDRASDVTIGDFWQRGYSCDFPRELKARWGVSFALGNSPAGRSLLELAGVRLVSVPRKFSELREGNAPYFCSSSRPAKRDEFFKSLVEQPFEITRRRFLRDASLRRRAFAFVRNFIPSGLIRRLRGL